MWKDRQISGRDLLQRLYRHSPEETENNETPAEIRTGLIHNRIHERNGLNAIGGMETAPSPTSPCMSNAVLSSLKDHHQLSIIIKHLDKIICKHKIQSLI
jgi:hypothetical protein